MQDNSSSHLVPSMAAATWCRWLLLVVILFLKAPAMVETLLMLEAPAEAALIMDDPLLILLLRSFRSSRDALDRDGMDNRDCVVGTAIIGLKMPALA